MLYLHNDLFLFRVASSSSAILAAQSRVSQSLVVRPILYVPLRASLGHFFSNLPYLPTTFFRCYSNLPPLSLACVVVLFLDPANEIGFIRRLNGCHFRLSALPATVIMFFSSHSGR